MVARRFKLIYGLFHKVSHLFLRLTGPGESGCTVDCCQCFPRRHFSYRQSDLYLSISDKCVGKSVGPTLNTAVVVLFILRFSRLKNTTTSQHCCAKKSFLFLSFKLLTIQIPKPKTQTKLKSKVRQPSWTLKVTYF